MAATRKFDKWLYFTIIGGIIVLYALLEWRFPIMYDDLGFLAIWNSFDVDNSSFPQIIANTYADIWIHQNGRIANTLAPLAVASPANKLVFSLLTGIAMAYIIGTTRKFSCFGHHYNQNFFLSLSWLLLLFFLPWRDNIFIADYALNYIFATAITLLIIYALVMLEKKGWKPVTLILMLLFAALAGMWHEGFSASTLAGICLYIIVRKFKVSPQFLAIAAVYAIFFVICFSAPGTQDRLKGVVDSENPDFNLRIFFEYYQPSFLLAGAYALFAVFPEGRAAIGRSLKNPFVIIGWGIVLSGYFISSMPNQPLRSTFWPAVFCIVNTLALLANNQWLKRFFSKKTLLVNSFSAIMLLACFAQGIITLYWVDKIRKQADYIMERMIELNEPVVFYDMIPRSEVSRAALGIPPSMMWQGFFNYFCVWLYHPADFLAVVPTDLQYADSRNGIALAGDVGAKRIGNYIVGPYRVREDEPYLVIPRDVMVETEDKNGVKENIKVLEMPFITEEFLHEGGALKADTLMFYKFDKSISPQKIQNIKKFNLLETLDY